MPGYATPSADTNQTAHKCRRAPPALPEMAAGAERCRNPDLPPRVARRRRYSIRYQNISRVATRQYEKCGLVIPTQYPNHWTNPPRNGARAPGHVACDLAAADAAPDGDFVAASADVNRAAGVEAAAFGRVGGAGDFAAQCNTGLGALHRGVGLRERSEQGLGVGVAGLCVKAVSRGNSARPASSAVLRVPSQAHHAA